MSELVEDLMETAGDITNCLLPRLTWINYWILMMVLSLIIKQKYLRPHLENYYKRTHAERSQRQKRRLQAMLDDHVLVMDLEDKLLQRHDIQGDRHKMLQAMQQLRDMAAADDINNSSSNSNRTNCGCDCESGSKNDTSKGQEKKEAAEAIFRATILLAIAVFFVNNITGLILQVEFSDDVDCWEGMGSVIYFVTFFLVHMIHSHKMVRNATFSRGHTSTVSGNARVKDSEITGSNKQIVLDTSSENDLNQPLLPRAMEQKTGSS